MTDISKATPRPYALMESSTSDNRGAFHLYLIEEKTGRKIAAIWGKDEEKSATGALLVRAVNAHEALAAALRELLDRYTDLVNCGDCGSWDPEKEHQVIAARAALALADGKP